MKTAGLLQQHFALHSHQSANWKSQMKQKIVNRHMELHQGEVMVLSLTTLLPIQWKRNKYLSVTVSGSLRQCIVKNGTETFYNMEFLNLQNCVHFLKWWAFICNNFCTCNKRLCGTLEP